MRNDHSEGETNEEPLINLTPLIDVVFVVLITFMVIAPLLEIDRVLLVTGSDQASKERIEASGFSITVRADNSIWVDGRSIALSDLKALAVQIHARNPTSRPKLIHDKRAQFGTYQEIKNMLEASGFEEMDLLVQPQ